MAVTVCVVDAAGKVAAAKRLFSVAGKPGLPWARRVL